MEKDLARQRVENEIGNIIEDSNDITLNDKLELCIPIFYSEDDNGNVNYDTESLREIFDNMIYEMERLNDESDFQSW